MRDNEQELLQLIRAGNPRGFQLLYAQYADRVMGFALRLSGSRSDAEDIVQEVFLAAWQGRDSFQGRSRLLTWLLGIASRRWRDRSRQYAPETVPFIEEWSGEPETTIMIMPVAGGGGMEAGVIDALTLERALAQLQPLFREALLLVTAQGLTQREAAEVMNEPLTTTKWRVWQAKKQMAALLHAVEKECNDVQQTEPRADCLA